MSLKTKATGLVGATVLLLAAGWVATNMNNPDGSEQPAPKGVIPTTVRRGASVVLFVGWQRPYTPARVTTFANDGRKDYVPRQLPALLGRVQYVYTYDPSVLYSITVDQPSPDAKGTVCQIVVAGAQVDHDSRDGVGTLHCHAHG